MSVSDPTSPVSIRRNDVLLALTFAVVQPTAVLLASSSVPAHLWPWFAATAVPLAAEGLALVLWRSRPLVCQALVWSAEAVTLLLLPATYVASGYGQLVVSFGMGMRFPLRRTAAALTALSLAYSAVDNWRDPPNQWELAMTRVLVNLAACLLPMLGGAALASSRRYEHSRQELLRREHGRQLEVALIQERRRLAGELHDVAAHHLAGIVVQASAVGVLIDKEPAAAKEAAAQLRSQSKETLEGLRSVVGMLREDEDTSPVAGLDDLPALVESTRELGVQVELLQPLTLPRLAPVVDATVYRVAQQALSNALQHAPGSAVQIEVITIGDYPRLEIVNSPAPRRALTTPAHTNTQFSGTGLAAMRERATLIGARFDAGPTTEGGWRVCLDLPMPAMTRGEA